MTKVPGKSMPEGKEFMIREYSRTLSELPESKRHYDLQRRGEVGHDQAESSPASGDTR